MDATEPEPVDTPAEAPKTAKRTRTKPGKDDAHTQTMNWYDRTPLSAQMFLQFGFAGLMAVVFVVQFRETSAENRASREMYRDDMAAMRAEIAKAVSAAIARDAQAENRTDKVVLQIGQVVHRIDQVSEKMTEVNHQLQRTTDAIRSAGVDIKKASDKMHDPTDDQGLAPPPRLKYPYPFTGPGGSP
jgi:hypothetical protein